MTLNQQVMKWLGIVFLLTGVTLNTLNTPEFQQYVYPLNLYVSLAGSMLLFTVARQQDDVPYQILNAVVLTMYLVGIWNAFCPIHETHFLVDMSVWPFITAHPEVH